MKLRPRLFPPESRFFPGQRWINIGLRTLHLLGMAGIGAAFLVPGAADGAWHDYLWLTLASGLGLILIFVWSNGIWLIQLRGQAILLKVLLLALIPVWPSAGPALFAAVVLLSGIISHAPARVRYFSPFHGRMLESLPERRDLFRR
ncbi:MAG: hypothetical protein U9Q81_06290 [Pseudomonadota bacterium]|nr:hypothetical protein [Pseudomonadota bacterium]